tara:strand:+ start:126167 stop:127597 length:1431 start_codon:yes stop_codon:yes gene_type:complete
MGRLFWKFFLAFWLALLIAGASVGTLVWFIHNKDETTVKATQPYIDEHVAGLVDILALAAQYGGEKSLSETIEKFEDKPLPTFYAIDGSGRDILGREINEQLVSEVKQWHLTDKNKEAVRTIIINEKHYLVFAVRSSLPFSKSSSPYPPPHIENNGHRPPPNFIHKGPPRPPSKWLLLIIGTIASLFFSAALAWYFFKPISHLRSGFKAVSNGDLTTKVSPAMAHRTDELADLGKSFDAMTGKIASLLSAQQRLLHDVSHEVRSPLARIQAAIGLAQQQPAKVNAMLDRIEIETQRISNLVGELLMLSKLESGTMTLQTTDFDFSDLLTVIVNNAKFEAQHKNISITYNKPFGEIRYHGNAELLHRAIENIVRNAIKFTPEDKEVIITLATDKVNKALLLIVEDNGPGVAEQDLFAIFEPFYKSEMPLRHDGVGLGLTIAHRAVSAHGGTIKAKNSGETGLKFEIILPLNDKPPSN